MSSVPCSSCIRFFAISPRHLPSKDTTDGRPFTGRINRGRIPTMYGTAISRRLFLAGGIGLSARALPSPKQESVYRFATPEWDLRMTVEFYDRYFGSGFWFRDLSAGRHFCLSTLGEEGRDCAAGFVGSLAIARYSFRP